MRTNSLLILGAGGHAKVVVDTVCCLDTHMTIEIRDDNEALKDKVISSFKVQTPIGELEQVSQYIHVAIGNNRARSAWYEKLLAKQKQWFTVVHSTAVIAQTAQIEAGCFIAAQSIVAPNATIRTGCIINHGAIVDHDCKIGAWCHVAPNATLGGNVILGNGCFVGAGAVILPGIEIGEWAVVGAGAVVTKDVKSGQTVVGVPATAMR